MGPVADKLIAPKTVHEKFDFLDVSMDLMDPPHPPYNSRNFWKIFLSVLQILQIFWAIIANFSQILKIS